MVKWKNPDDAFSDETLQVIGKIHNLVESQAGVGNVWSVEMLRRWLIDAGQPGIDVLQKYVSLLPKHLTRRFVTADGTAAVVTGRIPDKDASDLLPVINSLEEGLETTRQQHPAYEINVTGLAVIAAVKQWRHDPAIDLGPAWHCACCDHLDRDFVSLCVRCNRRHHA